MTFATNPKTTPPTSRDSCVVPVDRSNPICFRSCEPIRIAFGAPGKNANSYSYTYPLSAMCKKWKRSQRSKDVLHASLSNIEAEESKAGNSDTAQRYAKMRARRNSTRTITATWWSIGKLPKEEKHNL